MNVALPIARRRNAFGGYSMLELIIVVALVVIAAAVAVPLFSRANKTSDLETAKNDVANAIRSVSQRAATRAAAQSFDLSKVTVASSVAVFPDGVDLPDGTSPCEKLFFEGGTGYPIYDGRRAAVSVVLAERGQERTSARALVFSASAMLTEYRLVDGQWQEVK